MRQEKERNGADRRSFLKLAGVGAVLGGAAAVAGPDAAQAATEKARDEGRYHETEKIRQYYDLARF